MSKYETKLSSEFIKDFLELRRALTEKEFSEETEMEFKEFAGMIIDYTKAKECQNENSWYTCLQCGKCGRKFENGFMVDSGGTTPEDDEDE